MEKLDINGKIKQWEDTKKRDKKNVEELSKHNSDLTKEFLHDFELGLNVPKGKKGRRTPSTLLKLRGICIFLDRHFHKKDFEKLTKKEVHDILDKMSRGEILKPNGHVYNGTGEFAKNLKTFWGWLVKTGKTKIDITEDLARSDYSKGKPSWVYLTHEQMQTLIDQARGDYRALILFLYDSGVRPQEAYRLRVSDFNDDFTELNIPEKRENGDRVSKTFERTIKLKHCPPLIKKYVKTQKLRSDDLLIQTSQYAFNKYLKTLCKALFGTAKTKARGSYDQFHLYCIRHISCIYWLDKYQTNKDLMYRMGWSKEDKIFYYSEFLGRRDKIDDVDMLTKEQKTKLESELEEMKKQMKIMQKALINEMGFDGSEKTIASGKKKDNKKLIEVFEIK